MTPVVRFALGQTVLFNLVFVLLMVAGAFSVMQMPVERYPEVNFGKALIVTVYPGASPRDVEALVTREVEDSLEGLEEVEFIQGRSTREVSTVMVKFRDDTDYEALYDELRFRVLSVLDELPAGVDPPTFNLVRTSDWLPVVAVNLVGERSNRALSLMAEELRVPLGTIPGVMDAELQGEYVREFHVYLDPHLMEAHGVSYEQVAAALQDANVSIPAGDFTDASGEFVVSADARFRNRDQVVSTVVRRDADGSFVTVGDVASRAVMGHRDPDVITTVNGRSCVTIRVLKTDRGNALDIYDGVQAAVADFAPALARQGVEVVLTQDSTTYIEEAMTTLGSNLALGILLVSLVIWYFMGLRNAAITTVGIPFAFLVTMVFMYLTGNSLNEITLFSFVLVSGIVVDDAIVVVENIYRHVQNGEELEQAIVNGAAEVLMPVVSATATTVAAFLPMLIMTGATGEFFALIPKAIAFAIVASLIECIFILPIHFKDYGPRPNGRGVPDEDHDNALMVPLRRLTNRLIHVTLRFRITSVVTVLIAFVVSLAMLAVSVAGIAPLIRIKFFPDDYNLYYAFVEGPPHTPIADTSERVRAISEFIMADGPGAARSAAGFAGFVIDENYEQQFGRHLGTVMVALPATADRDFEDALDHLEEIAGRLEARFGTDGFRIRVRAEKDGPPAGKDVSIRVVGSDDGAVERLADGILGALAANPDVAPHLSQLADDRGEPARLYRFEVDEQRAHEYGLSKAAAARLAASVLDGRYIGKYRTGDEEVDLKLRVDPAYLERPHKALDIPVLEHPSGPVRLGDVARAVPAVELDELARYQGQRSLTITADIRSGTPISTPLVVKWVKGHYAAIRDDYPGATITFGGAFDDTQRSYRSLTYAFGLAVLLIYLILATQFRSYGQPLIVLSAVVFSIIGVVLGKFVSQSLFTVNSFIAVVGVTGVVVNDSLVLLHFINRNYRAGMSRRAAILEGVRLRLRPILLTTLTTSLGLLPMAVGVPSYSLVWGTMASTFVAGLATATFLTLFIIPVEWDLMMGWQERRARRRHRLAAAGGAT
ncbi:MAG: efflux RND transporter permease subunit [Gammaproteobacteria bacterium]|nr:efflux RND transporter permease subunit [Gammaproteobacteria bacterium]